MPTSTYESDPNRERDNATTRSSVSAETTDGKPASIPSIETSISLNLDAFGRIDINSLLAPITPNPSHDPSTTPTAKSFHVMDINQTPSEEHVAPSTALTDKGNSIRAGSVLNSVKASKKSNDVTEYFQKGYEAYKVLLETYPDSMWHVVGYPRFKDDARNDDNTMVSYRRSDSDTYHEQYKWNSPPYKTFLEQHIAGKVCFCDTSGIKFNQEMQKVLDEDHNAAYQVAFQAWGIAESS